ncbi:hypothetical protein CkaCkLH20_09217 [Colletotrichum karsti]|uniref:Heterokaryon incompatibility domain-containing protein n=1 Tax=Colletotrichum karsti TaxID=1095194 RepID=A0A9P6LEQ0_9PEZI|nr:uncharacterized protein CkaCkLH20_09217 [Colletotrichum karsti]KAF9873404.1 hypothetical protein CkaCkLH20_09217 [Colletotrichum karsti]
MRTKKKGWIPPASDIDYEILRLKRSRVAGDAKGHSCDKCSGLWIKPLPEPDQQVLRKIRWHMDTTKAKARSLAASGCSFWAIIQQRIDYEDFKVVLEQQCNKFPDDQFKYSRWQKEHYEALAEVPEDFIRVLLSYADVNDFNWGGFDERSAKVELDLLLPSNPAGVRYGSHRWMSHWVTFLLLGLPGDFGDVRQTYVGSPVNLSPGNPDSMQLSRHWLKRCETDHGCGINSLPSAMPSFLLDVSDPNQVSLVTVSASMRERYVALSYCWGVGEQKTMLKKANKSSLLSGISLTCLDPTVRDSIQVTRELGLQFIWIDALCIIQDDNTFKAKELGKMGNIYQCATFTIIASAAKDVTQGFLNKRTPTAERIAGMTLETQPAFSIEARGKRGKTMVKRPVLLTPSHRESIEPWYRRAWTFQEFLFSRRRLQYNGNQTTWTCYCGDTVAQECDGWVGGKPNTHPGLIYMDQEVFATAMEILGQKKSSQKSVSASELLELWYNLVSRYSERNLTYQSDRLPAISAIAQEIASLLNDQYICGLWESDFLYGLLWSDGDPGADKSKRGPRPTSRPKPSWTWASHDGEVAWTNVHLEKTKDKYFEILHRDVQLKSPDAPFGEVTKGELRVRGLMRSIPLPADKCAWVSPSGRSMMIEDHEIMVELDDDDDARLKPGAQTKLSLLVVAYTGRTIIEGLVVMEDGSGRDMNKGEGIRVGWFHTENSQPGFSESKSGEDEERAREYRKRLRALWGRKNNVREIVLL